MIRNKWIFVVALLIGGVFGFFHTISNSAEASSPPFIKVKKGDTLYQIAKSYHCDMQELIKENRLQDPSFIRVGQKLYLPQKDKNLVKNKDSSKEVMTFSRGKFLGTFTLTAYTAGIESTGKTPDDPGYGITSSGSKALDGFTIAVDPNVIPIGSRVYIEGIGYRVAQDIGSAIKGKRIDVFISHLKTAKEFGVKKNVRVELIE